MTLKGDFPDPEEVAALAMMALAAVALAGGLVVDTFWRLPLLRRRIPGAPAAQLPPRRVRIAWHVIPCAAGILFALLVHFIELIYTETRRAKTAIMFIALVCPHMLYDVLYTLTLAALKPV